MATRSLSICCAVAIVSATLASPIASADQRGVTKDTIRIGNIGPYTGDASSFRSINEATKAIYMWINDTKGGIHGRKFQVIDADSACNEAKGIAAAKKLIFDDKVFIIHSNCSGVGMAIKPILLENKVPWLGPSGNPKIVIPPSPGFFHPMYTGREYGRAMGDLAATFPDKKIAVVAHTNDWARGYADPAIAALKARGITPVLDIAMERGSTDAATQALKIKAAGAGLILGALYEAELAILIRDTAKFGIKAPVIGAVGADFESTIRRVGNPAAVNGRWCQPYQYQAKLNEGPLKKWHDILVKYVPKKDLPADGEPTNFYYFGISIALVTAKILDLMGPDNVTFDNFNKTAESLKNYETTLLADTVSYSPTDHVGAKRLNAQCLDENGHSRIVKSWGELIH